MMRRVIGLGLATLCILTAVLSIGAGGDRIPVDSVDLRKSVLYNETAYIPPQCYTKTEDDAKRVHNACYVCHTRSREPNYINDHDLQQTFSLPEPALTNPWRNLFEDRRERIAQISDAEIQAYIEMDNYRDADGRILLANRLTTLPANWDYNGNGRWDGYSPDCYFNFDTQGFDMAPNGEETGWRAFAYYPFPGTFWPTNGATDDILIRLAEPLRQNTQGQFDREVYRLNLAIVEAVVKMTSVAIDPVDERAYEVDLDKDGRLGTAEWVVYDWEPREGRLMSYVGAARKAQEEGKLHLAAGLFPEGTEFLHSVRYIGIDGQGAISLAQRMKELRYMKKRTWQTYADLEEAALAEMKERDDFPDRIKQLVGNAEQGINNGNGWLLQGFIEDRQGHLRPQTFEETAFCIGCHGGVGATTDSVFGFPRKLDKGHHQGGWYHWTQKGWAGLSEPKIEVRGAGVFYEYSYYLMYNQSANEFRNNPEVSEKFYNADGSAREDMLDQLHDDISLLLNPTRERALALNKAYRTIVADQDFVQGRDVNLEPLKTVHESVTQDLLTGVRQPTNIQRFGGRFGPERPPLPAVTKPVHTSVSGKGMVGPSGIPYEADWEGVIHKSRYSMDIPGVHFTFPRRLTLPTRVIVPVGKNPACLTCHRIDYPTVPGNTASIAPPDIAHFSAPDTLPAGLKRLTNSSAGDRNGVWRPDGEMIAFVSDRSGGSQIWLMNKKGQDQRQLTRGDAVHAWPQWSPDGKQLVAWSYDTAARQHRVVLIDIASGKTRDLVASSGMLDRPVFHPNGQHVAYAAQVKGNWDIWLVRLADGETMRLTSEAQMESNPLWSADGKVLSYKVAPATGVYSLTGQYFMTFENGYANPTIHAWNGPESVQMNHWSPDGGRIAYTAEVISDASGRDQVTYAAMVSDLNLTESRANATGTRLLAKGLTLGDRGPVFSPGGDKVAFWAWNRDGAAAIWLFDLEADALEPLATGGGAMYPQWRPDGNAILFESNVNGQVDLFTVAVAAR